MTFVEKNVFNRMAAWSGNVEVDRVFEIHPDSLKVFSSKLQKLVDIPIPKSHVGERPVSCHLISARRRIKMVSQ